LTFRSLTANVFEDYSAGTGHGDPSMVVSYLIMRRVIGILGMALPVILIVWGFFLLGFPEFRPSLSDYYALRARDAFVGILFAIACFLFAYRGYAPIDNLAGDLGAVFALGVAFFPCNGAKWEQGIHFTSAGLLFLVLSGFSLFLFTRSKGGKTDNKKVRNRIYVGCGVAMLLCIALIGLYKVCGKNTVVAKANPVLWLEVLALWTFGISWFVKGETLWQDR